MLSEWHLSAGLGPANASFLWVCFSKHVDIALCVPELGTTVGGEDRAQRNEGGGGVKGSLGPGVCPHGRAPSWQMGFFKWREKNGCSLWTKPSSGRHTRAPPPTTDFAAHPSRAAPRPVVPSSRFLLVFLLFPALATCSLCVQLPGRVRFFVTPWIVAHQAPQSMEFSRQESWRGLSFPSAGDLPDPGIEPGSLMISWHWQADSLPLCHLEPGGLQRHICKHC